MSTLESEELVRPAGSAFPVETGEVLHRLRSSVSELLKTMPTTVRSTRDLQKLLGVNVTLCWQVMKLASPGDALSLVQYVPNPGPMSRFLSAATNFGVDNQIVSQIRSAYGAFEEQVAIHAGDRTTFESMATGSVSDAEGSDDDLQRAALKLRKSGFQLYSQYMGAQLDTYLVAHLLHPGSIPGQYKGIHLRTKFGLRRLRPDADLIVDRLKLCMTGDLDHDLDTFRKDTFDPESCARFGAPVIAEFSTQPLPQFTTLQEPDGRTFTKLVGDTIGKKSSADLVFGQMIPNVPVYKLPDGTVECGQNVGVNTPTAVMIIDQLVHRSSFTETDWSFAVLLERTMGDPTAQNFGASLPFRERIIKLEGGVEGAATREVPRYIELLEFVCKPLNWKLEEFDVFRVRVEYPLMYTRLRASMKARPVGSEIEPHIMA